ncbi:MAG: hypothetical protein Q8P82_01905 [bacterium]|nr:hypothetical protein [bacterium]
MDVVNGMFLGAAVGLVIAIPAFVSELTRRGKNLPLLMDVHACWKRTCTPEETFLLSLFTHILASLSFGGLYAFFAIMGWGNQNFHLPSIAAFGMIFYLLIGVIILPLAGLGMFARKEGRLVWLELFAIQFLTSVGLWFAYRMFPVFLPN